VFDPADFDLDALDALEQITPSRSRRCVARPAGNGDAVLARLRRRFAALDDASAAPAVNGSPVDVAKVAADLRDAARVLGRLDWDVLGVQAALGLTDNLEAARRAVTTALAGALVTLDASGATVQETELAVPSWFAHTMGTSRADGARLLKLGRALARFELFNTEISAGGLSIAHGEALAAACNRRNTDALVAVERLLFDHARTHTYLEWLTELRRAADLADADGPTPDSERSKASLHTVGHAEVLNGELYGAAGERFRQSLDAELTRLRRQAWRDHKNTGAPVPGTAQLRAAALCELVRRGVANSDSTTAARTEAVIVIEARDDLAAQVSALDGRPLPPALVEQLTCDAHLQVLITDAHGQPLWLGRTRRIASAAQRQALAIRDGGCIFPGCDMPPDWCDAHHSHEWEHGGGTDIANLAYVCRRHHGTAHSKRWTLRPAGRDPDDTGPPGQRFEWLNHRTGEVIPAQQRGLR